MIKKTLTLFIVMVCGVAYGQQRFYNYPSFQRAVHKETKFGIEIEDPYKSLEDMHSDSTKKWVEAQNKLLESYRRSIFPKYTTCRNLLFTSVDYFDLFGKSLSIKQNFYFSFDYSSSEKAPSIMYKRDEKHEYQYLCPTDVFQRDKEDKIFVRGLSVSKNEKYVAISLSHSGSDWEEIRVRDIEKRSFLPDTIPWAKFGQVVWKDDGFFYSKFDKPEGGDELLSANKNQRIMYHRLGDDIAKDREIFKAPDDENNVYFQSVDSARQLIFYYVRKENEKRVSVVGYLNTDSMESGVKEFLLSVFDGTSPFQVVAKKGEEFLVMSTNKAPNGKVMLCNPEKRNSGRVIIGEYNQPLRSVSTIKDRIFCIYYDRGKFIPVVFDTAGNVLKRLDIPEGYAVSGFYRALNDSQTFYTISSFHALPRTVKFDFKHLKTIVYDDNTGSVFSDLYVSKIVHYPSKDSTMIPMYVVYHRDVKPDSTTPVLMYAYGGFGVPTDPSYNMGFKAFMSMGGILAVPLIRGGGEMGESWHKAGMRLNKQKCFDDFIAAAEYLVANNYTSSKKLVIHGGSNGGLLVGAAMVQRPELFGVVVPAAAVLDLVNFFKFSTGFQVGMREYGDPNDSLEFHNLYALSPMHHIKKDVVYPPTMILASDHDDRVVPIHSYKFLAALQNDTKEQTNPYLLYLEKNQGHTMEGTYDDIQQMALMYAFIFENLGINVNKMNFK